MAGGGFLGSFLQSFAQAKQYKQKTEDDKVERDARMKLFELQMKREQTAQQQQQESLGARDELFARLSGQQSLQSSPMKLEDPRGPMSLTDMLADPQAAILALRAGVVNPADMLKKQEEPPAVQLLRALAADPQLAEVDRARKAAGASTTRIDLGDRGLTKPPEGFFRPDPTKPGLQVEPGGPVQAEAKLKKRDLDNALALYETAKQGLLTGLGQTTTGPLMGKLPAITSGQQVAQGSVAAMAPVLKQLFRAAGEGVFTDKDQQLLIDMIPTRETNPKARESMLQNIDAIIRAKLGLAQSSGAEVDFSELPD